MTSQEAFEKWASEQDGVFLDEVDFAKSAWQAAEEACCRRMCVWCKDGKPTTRRGRFTWEHEIGTLTDTRTGVPYPQMTTCAASPIREGMAE